MLKYNFNPTNARHINQKEYKLHDSDRGQHSNYSVTDILHTLLTPRRKAIKNDRDVRTKSTLRRHMNSSPRKYEYTTQCHFLLIDW